MTKYEKLYERIIVRGEVKGIRFDDLRFFLERSGFLLKKVTGDHFLYVIEGVKRPVNIQPSGNEAKSYQLKQVRAVFNEKPSRNLPTLVGRGMRISRYVLNDFHFVY